MNITYRLSKKGIVLSDKITVYEVLARLHTGDIDQYAKTGVYVPLSYTDNNSNKKVVWSNGFVIIPKVSYADDEQVKLRDMLMTAKNRLIEIDLMARNELERLLMKKKTPPKDWLQCLINGTTEASTDTLCDIYGRYIEDERLNVSESTKKQYLSLLNNLRRYEAYNNVVLMLDNITPDTLHDFNTFMLKELHNSANTASRRMKRLRTFIRWANGLNKDFPVEPITHNNPFDKYSIGSEQYGTPFYLTIEERNYLEGFDFEPRLARQRDIFVFQCLIGCRVSDLWTMTKSSIVDGAVEYIPKKTKDDRPITVRVPLNSHAKAILDKYKDNGDDKLFPFVAQQQYNEDIKDMLEKAGITRIVTVLNPLTREEVKRRICDVASSHLARRTFIGNLYKQVKDPNLVGKLSGHTEGSKAFARYRDIDEDIAKELVSMLE